MKKGPVRNLLFLLPAALALTACDPCNEKAGTICLFAGEANVAQAGPDGVPPDQSPLYLPQDVDWGPDGSAWVIDFNNHRIRHIDDDGMIRTKVGTGFLGDGPPGPALAAGFNHPTGVAWSPNDPNTMYIAAWHNSRVESVDLTTGMLSFDCGTGERDYGGDGGPAVDAALDLPVSVAFDSDGYLYISDQANQIIRKVDFDGIIETYAGMPDDPGFAGDGGPAADAQFHSLVGQAADPSSKMVVHDDVIYLADTQNQVVRTIDLSTGTVRTLAGTPETLGYADGPADQAQFDGLRDVAVAGDGTVFVADTENSCVRQIRDGQVTTVAGVCGTPGYAGEYGPATKALLNRPYGVSVGPNGNLYIADTLNQVIRIVYRE